MAEELRSKRLQPDVVTQSRSPFRCEGANSHPSFHKSSPQGSLILAHTRAGDLQGAEEVLKGMRAWGLLPNVAVLVLDSRRVRLRSHALADELLN